MASGSPRSRVPAALLMAVLMALASCAAPRSGAGAGIDRAQAGPDRGRAPGLDAQAVPPLAGRVAFPARKVQAVGPEVVSAAAVALIHTGTNTAVASTVTRADGGFSLELRGFRPETGAPYLLEASKGLGGYRPGGAAPRFRTFVSYDGARWRSIAEPEIVIDSLTTAVAVLSGLDTAVSPAFTLGKVNSGVRPPGLNPVPDFGGQRDAQIVDLAADIVAYLAGDVDPVGAIGRIGPMVDSLSANSGRAGDIVEVRGAGFSPLPGDKAAGGNTVRFGGAVASVLLATPTQLVVRVPAGANGSGVTVETQRGSSAGASFSYQGGAVFIEGISPASGDPGGTVTIFGGGFAPAADQNTVTFGGGATATPTAADRNSLVVAVPPAARTGALTVAAPDGTSNPAFFTVPPRVTSLYPHRGAKGQDVEIRGSHFGTVAGTVTFGGATASVQSWSDEKIVALVPAGASSGPVAVAAGGAAGTGPAFGVLAGDIKLLNTNVLRTIGGHRIGWMARIGRYLYVGGGMHDAPSPTLGTDVPGTSWDGNWINVERALVNADGTLGAFAVVPGVNLTHNSGHLVQATTVIGRHAYVFGGGVGTSEWVQRAQIDASDNISTFANYIKLKKPQRFGTSIRVRDWVYQFGGYNDQGDGYFKTIQRARIRNAAGDLDPFEPAGETARYCHFGAVFQVGKYVYLVGGADAAAWDPGHGAVQRAEIVSADGTLGAFAECDNSGCLHLPVPFRWGTAAVIGDHVYLFFGFGGVGGSSWNNGVWRSRILDADGNLGSFLPYTLSGHAAFHWPPVPMVFGSRVYVYGGLINSGVTNGWDEFEIR